MSDVVDAPVLVRDAALAHLRWGDLRCGRVAVLLHGVGGSRESWGDTLSGTGRALAQAGLCAVAVDLPGYGHTPALVRYDMAGLAQQLQSLLDQLQAGGASRVALVGHSMGGMVAQELMARQAPALVRSLVLIATSPAFGKADGTWQRDYLAQRLAPLDAGQGMSALAPGLARGMASPQALQDAVARAAVLMSAVPEATYRSALHAIVGFDRREALAGLAVPVLCIAGADDRNAPPAVMKHMAERIAQAQYHCLPGVGHLAHMEAPQQVNPLLVDFLQTTL
jgi:pimeloyl-ACP methyl ester carboxylesterase